MAIQGGSSHCDDYCKKQTARSCSIDLTAAKGPKLFRPIRPSHRRCCAVCVALQGLNRFPPFWQMADGRKSAAPHRCTAGHRRYEKKG